MENVSHSSDSDNLSPRLKELQAELLEQEKSKFQNNQEQRRSSKPTLFLLLSGIMICLVIFLFLNYMFGFEKLIDRDDNIYKGLTFITLLLGIPFLLVSFFIGRRIADNLIKERKRSSVVSGLIVSNSVEEGWEEAGKIYRPLISYQFDINNSSYTNTFRPWKHWHTSKDRARKVLDIYKTGKVISVFYDPDDIQNSGVTRTKRSKYLIMIFIFTLSCILTSTGIYTCIRFVM